MLHAARFGRVCLITGYTSCLRGPSHQALTLLRRVRFIAWRLRHHKKGNADGAWGIFGTAERVWASALRPDPPKKEPCATLVCWWGIWPISTLVVHGHSNSKSGSSNTFCYHFLLFPSSIWWMMADSKFNLKLIPEFHDSVSGPHCL